MQRILIILLIHIAPFCAIAQNGLPDSADVIVITYETLPLFDQKGRPVQTSFKDRYYQILWDQYIITKYPSEDQNYGLRNTAMDKNWACFPGKDGIWRRSIDAYKFRYLDPKAHHAIKDTLLGYEVYKCTATADGTQLTAWHTEDFGEHYRLGNDLPGIPLYYEEPYLDHLVSVVAKAIDTQYISTEFFQHEKMRDMIPIQIDARKFGYKTVSVQKGIREGQRMRAVHGRFMDGTKFKRSSGLPIVYIFFAAMPDIGLHFKKLNTLIAEFQDRIDFVAITYDGEKQTRALFNIFPLECPVMVNKLMHFVKMGYERNYFVVVVDESNYVTDVIFEYPHHLEKRLRTACARLTW